MLKPNPPDVLNCAFLSYIEINVKESATWSMNDPETCKAAILSEDYRDFIVNNNSAILAHITEENFCTQAAGFHYRCIYLPKELAGPITDERLYYAALPKCYAHINMDSLNQAGILSLQNYPTLRLMGNGILIGFLDSGIDYQNPIFRNLDGSTRIAAIWDQTVQGGTPPEGFAYGTEYTEEMLNEALRSETPLEIVPSIDDTGHGTFIASLAAGGGSPEENFVGAAPEATLAVVKLKTAKQYLRDYFFIPDDEPCHQETDVILALHYLDILAQRLGLPLVFCFALGTNSGGHVAALPCPILMNSYGSSANRIPVIGCGNEADKRHHYYYELPDTNTTHTAEIRIGEGVKGFTMELWTTIPDILSISITSPSGQSTARLTVRSNSRTEFQFILEPTKVSIDYQIITELETSELIFFRFMNPSPGIWRLNIEPLRIFNGRFHIWLPISEFLSGEVYFLDSNPYYTITNPANGSSTVNVAFYDGNTTAIALSSGRGYSRNDIINPTLAAPGINVRGALPDGRYTNGSGSSASTAICAGAAALLLEWLLYRMGNPSVDSYQVKGILTIGARRPPGVKFPNREWGYGLLDLYNTILEIRDL